MVFLDIINYGYCILYIEFVENDTILMNEKDRIYLLQIIIAANYLFLVNLNWG